MSKNAHILCVAAGTGEGRCAPGLGFTTLTGQLADMIEGDLWVGPRPHLETLRPIPAAVDPFGFVARLTQRLAQGDAAKDLAELLGGGASLSDLFSTPRAEGGVDYPAYLQIIPYYLFRNRGRYFNYVRPTKGSEARLHGKVSIGIGGHVDLKDVVADEAGRIDLEATLEAAGKREAAEEIGAQISDHAFRFIGTIYAVDTEVDRVHFGIVGVCDLSDEQAEGLTPNDEIEEPGFRTLAEIKADTDADPTKTLETWTRLVIESNPLA